MKLFRRTVLFTALISAPITPTFSWSGVDNRCEESNSIEARDLDPTRCTPCPFINTLIRNNELDPVETTVEELVTIAKKYGVDSRLMEKLASAVTESNGSKKILLSKLLDPNRRPAHLGSLARGDRKLDTVEMERINRLVSFASNGRISLEQIHSYQKYCWQMSEMGWVDKIISDAEVQLLWSLFGAYRVQSENGTETIPANLVVDFLRDNTLPDSFKINEEDPATLGRLILSIIYSRIFGC